LRKILLAIYHFSAQVIGRGQGRSVVAAAAYRAGEFLRDERTGIGYDYTRRKQIAHTEILTPGGVPGWAKQRGSLWNQVENRERRSDSQTAREINVALPVELSLEQNLELLRKFIREKFVSKGMICDLAVHDAQGHNPHAHLLLTMRAIEGEQFGKKRRDWNDRKLLEAQREAWAEAVNLALENCGVEDRVDNRSLEAQGIEDRVAQIHLGPNVAAMKRKREALPPEQQTQIPITEREEIFDRIVATNLELQQLQQEANEIEEQLLKLQDDRQWATELMRLCHQLLVSRNGRPYKGNRYSVRVTPEGLVIEAHGRGTLVAYTNGEPYISALFHDRDREQLQRFMAEVQRMQSQKPPSKTKRSDSPQR
jgi:hypothetical protein